MYIYLYIYIYICIYVCVLSLLDLPWADCAASQDPPSRTTR